MIKSNKRLIKICVNKDATIFQAIENLSISQLGIVLVVEDSKLLGTITDGDIRRGILKYNDMNIFVDQIMRKKPKFLRRKDNESNIESFMIKNGIQHVPIVDSSNNIIDIKIKSELFEKAKKDNSVLISAGGFGKRLQPFTNNIPKPMIKIDDVPILEIILNKFIKSGFINFYISTYYKSNIIKKYFENGNKFGVNIKYIEEKKPLGTGGSLSLLDLNSTSGPVVLMNSDIITELNFDDLLRFHKKNKSDLTICTSKYEYTIPFGEVISSNTRVRELREKPKKSVNINAGIYVIEKKIIDNLKRNKKIDMPELINNAITQSKKVTIFPIHEYWADIGRIEELDKVRNEIILSK